MALWIVLAIFAGMYLFDSFIYKPIKNKNNNNNNKTLADYFKDEGFTYISPLSDMNYLGGIKDISIKNRIDYILTNEGLLLLYCDGNIIPSINSEYTKRKLINWNDIKDISLQTEQSIKEKVSLGKLVCFGIFAFAMNGKEKISTKEYIVLTMNDTKGEYNILFEAKDNQYIVEKLNKRIA